MSLLDSQAVDLRVAGFARRAMARVIDTLFGSVVVTVSMIIAMMIWPKETPRRPDVDLELVARRFEIAGGSIRNIAVGAAVLAADNGGSVNIRHLLHATRREYQKMGKVIT